MAQIYQDGLNKALRILGKRDPQLRRAIKRFGNPKSRKQPAGFATLARIIVDQQLSTKAAAAIWKRMVHATGRLSPTTILAQTEDDLLAVGLSGSKVKTLRELSLAISSGSLRMSALSRKEDASVKTALTEIWGIGDWTADIYLMFALGRPDVWPVGDLAALTGWQIITESSDRISAEELMDLAETWRPHRSAAAIMLWHAVGQTRTKK